jgi:hypothetical protein
MNLLKKTMLTFQKKNTSLGQLRTSCHPLKIETGRHCKPPWPRENRLCSVCNVIDEEEHFLASCKKYEVFLNLLNISHLNIGMPKINMFS